MSTTAMPSSDIPYVRLDLERVEAWAQQLARSDLSEISGVFAANGAVSPRVLWRPQIRQLPTVQLRFFMDYWNDLRGAADLPRSDRVDLKQLAAIQGYEVLIDVINEGRDFRCCHFGRVLAAVSGMDMTGRLLSEPWARTFIVECTLAQFRAAFRRGEPIYTERDAIGTVMTKSWHRLLLPLADEVGKVDSFLVGFVPIGVDGLPVYMHH